MASGDKTTVYDMVKVRAELTGSGFTADKVDGKDADAFVSVDLANVADSTFLDKIKAVDGSGSGIDADLVRGLEPAVVNGEEVLKADGSRFKMQPTAYVVFDGTDGTILESYGISSVTRNEPGDYDLAFTSDMSNKLYSVYITGVYDESSDDISGNLYQIYGVVKRDLNKVHIHTIAWGGSVDDNPVSYDYNPCCVIIFGGR